MSTQFAGIVQRMNAGSHLRAPGSSPPEVCDVYRDADAEGRMLINAVLGFEITHERRVRPDDEPAMLTLREEAQTTMKAGKAHERWS